MKFYSCPRTCSCSYETISIKNLWYIFLSCTGIWHRDSGFSLQNDIVTACRSISISDCARQWHCNNAQDNLCGLRIITHPPPRFDSSCSAQGMYVITLLIKSNAEEIWHDWLEVFLLLKIHNSSLSKEKIFPSSANVTAGWGRCFFLC